MNARLMLALSWTLCLPLAVNAQIRNSLPVQPKMITQDTYGPSFLIPAMGSIQGNGAFFRSALTLCNFRAQSQDIDIYWFPRDVSGSISQPVLTITVPALLCPYYDDFVGNQLRLSGLGAARFVAVVSGTHTPDPNAYIDGFSRIWSAQAGTGGTFSQSFPAVSDTNLDTRHTALLVGLRQDAQYRCNLGIVNLSPVSRTFDVGLYDGSGGVNKFAVTVAAYSLNQQGLPAGNWGALNLLVTPRDGPISGSWAVYGSSVDNITGDAWTNKGYTY